MQVAVVVVTYNNAQTIYNCLTSVFKEQPDSVIIVDNLSTDDTVRIVKHKFKSSIVLVMESNSGFAGGNNIGIEKALELNPDYILILNPDVILGQNSLKNLLFYAETHIQPLILGPLIYQHNYKLIWSAGGELDKKRFSAILIGHDDIDCGQYKDTSQVNFVSGTCMLIPRDLLEKGLRFCDLYFLYYEDVEFCLQAYKLGYPSFIVPQAKIIHYEVSAVSYRQPVKNYYLARNHLLFVERNAPFRVKLRELVRLPKTVYEHYQLKDTAGISGIIDFFRRRFGYYDIFKPKSRTQT